MSQPPSPGDRADPSPPQPRGWADPYAPGSGDAGPPTQPPSTPPPPAYPATAYSTPAGPPGYAQPFPYAARPSTNGLAIAAMVCSLAGLGTALSAPVGAILGHVARRQIRERGEEGDGMARTGIIVGWALTALWALCCGGYIGLFGWLFTRDPSTL